MPAPIAGVLLAAGAARRFGGGKLLHPLQDGVPVGISALRRLQAAVDALVVVVRPEDQTLAARFRSEGAPVVFCADADLGMAHSLAAGVAATRGAGGWIIALADMPNVRSATIRAVADQLSRGARIVLPVFRGQRGHPVGFAQRCGDELLALHGDHGARALLERHAAEVVKLEVDDPGVLQDVDTREDAQRIDEDRREGDTDRVS
jgi:molybdenum cofactor cytidylyltransferase